MRQSKNYDKALSDSMSKCSRQSQELLQISGKISASNKVLEEARSTKLHVASKLKDLLIQSQEADYSLKTYQSKLNQGCA